MTSFTSPSSQLSEPLLLLWHHLCPLLRIQMGDDSTSLIPFFCVWYFADLLVYQGSEKMVTAYIQVENGQVGVEGERGVHG